jgi:sec-independent protein translocase protein TatA
MNGFALFNVGSGEMFWIFLIFLILFGAAALPRLFRSLGKSVREFKRASEGLTDEMEKAAEDEEVAKGEAAAKGEDAAKGEEAKKKAKPEPPTDTNE